MIQSSGELKFGETTLSDIDADNFNDKIVFTVTNELADTVAVTNITLQGRNETASVDWTTFTNDDNTTTTFPFNIATSQSKIGVIITFDPGTYDEIRIKVDYEIGDVAQDALYSTEYDVAV